MTCLKVIIMSCSVNKLGLLTPVTPIALSDAFGSVDVFLFLIKEDPSTSAGHTREWQYPAILSLKMSTVGMAVSCYPKS